MNLAERRSIMNAFIFLQFGYYPFRRREINNCINSMHERASRILFGDYVSTFKQLLKQNESA